MKEIKFRVWLPTGKLIQWADFAYNFDDSPIAKDHFHFAEFFDSLKSQGVKLMQFTGLKDKNGTEIYEGDILEYDDGKIGPITYKIFYSANKVAFAAKVLGNDRFTDLAAAINGYTWCNKSANLKVIGNIYENPELVIQELESGDE